MDSMVEGLLKSGLVAAQNDFGNWAEFIFFLVIVLFSVAGSIIKSVSVKKGQKQQGGKGLAAHSNQVRPTETWQQRLARKAEEFQRAVEAKYEDAKPPPRREPAATAKGPDPGKLTVRTDPSGESVMVYEKGPAGSMTQRQAIRQRQARDAVAGARRAEAQRPMPALHTRNQPAPMEMEPTMQPEATVYGTMARSEPQAVVSGPRVIDYEDPEALRKAILHYEILGKPLAYRDPFERGSAY